MTQEILDIINKNLPTQVGETLRGVLNQGEADRKALAEMRVKFDLRQSEITELQNRLNKLSYLETKEKEILASLDSIKEQKINMALILEKTKLDEALKSKNDIFRLAEIVFKNPTLTYSHSVNENDYGTNSQKTLSGSQTTDKY